MNYIWQMIARWFPPKVEMFDVFGDDDVEESQTTQLWTYDANQRFVTVHDDGECY